MFQPSFYESMSIKAQKKIRVIFALLVFASMAVVFFASSGGGQIAGVARAQTSDSTRRTHTSETNISATQATAPAASAEGSDVVLQQQEGINFAARMLEVIVRFAAYLLSLLASISTFFLDLGEKVIIIPAVKTGWDAVLSVTNLGFVLAIIVIAFATIFRVENYAMRQTLARLIIAALLVNFSMVIGGALITTSNVFAHAFQSAITQTTLADALGNAIQPQQLFNLSGTIPSGFSAATNATGYIEQLIKIMIALAFIALFLLMAVLVFATLTVMLAIRVIWLSVLLVLSPIVWLAWVFPRSGLFKYWTDWWRSFIKWNLFAPAVLFFLYLAIAATQPSPDNPVTRLASQVGQGNAAKGFEELGIMGSGIVTYILNLSLILGFMFGGIFIANMIGVAGGDIGVRATGRIGKWAGGGLGKLGMRAASAPFRGATGQKATEALQRAGGRTFFGRLAAAPLRAVGGAAAQVRAGATKSILSDSNKKIGAMDIAGITAAFPTMSSPDKVAAIQRLVKEKKIGNLKPGDVEAFLGDNGAEAMFKRYDAGGTYKAFSESVGMNHEIVSASGGKAKKEAYDKYMQALSPGDFSNLSKIRGYFTDHEDSVIRLQALVENRAGLGHLAKIVPSLSSNNQQKFWNNFKQTTLIPNQISLVLETKVKKEDATDAQLLEHLKSAMPNLYKEYSSKDTNAQRQYLRELRETGDLRIPRDARISVPREEVIPKEKASSEQILGYLEKTDPGTYKKFANTLYRRLAGFDEAQQRTGGEEEKTS